MRRLSAIPTAVLLALLFAGACAAREPVTSQQLAQMLSNPEGGDAPLVLDVRTPQEFAQGRIPGAVLVPHDQLADRLAELDRNQPVVVYCRSGRRSTLAETLLQDAGYDVRQLQGSWQAWQAAGQQVECPAEGCAPANPPEDRR